MNTVDPKRARKNAGCIAVFVTFVVVMLGIGLAIQSYLPHVTATRTANKFEACLSAQDFVRDQLKAPSTAVFASCTAPDSTVTQTGRVWTVRSFVDAQNGFGAQIRNDYTAKVIYYPATDTWNLTDLAMDGR